MKKNKKALLILVFNRLNNGIIHVNISSLTKYSGFHNFVRLTVQHSSRSQKGCAKLDCYVELFLSLQYPIVVYILVIYIYSFYNVHQEHANTYLHYIFTLVLYTITKCFTNDYVYEKNVNSHQTVYIQFSRGSEIRYDCKINNY